MDAPTPHPACADAVLDPERLAALYQTGLLDSIPSEDFDRLTQLTARVASAPVSLVALIDANRSYFKSEHGIPDVPPGRSVPLSHSLCQHVVGQGAPLVIEDARTHPLVRDNGGVTDLGVGAYLGVPVRAPTGHILGSLCAIDLDARAWTEADQRSVAALAASVESEIALRGELEARRLAEAEAQSNAHTLSTVLGNLNDIVFQTDAEGRFSFLNDAWEERTGYAIADTLGQPFLQFAAGDTEALRGRFANAAPQGSDQSALQIEIECATGRVRHFEVRGRMTFDADGVRTGSAGTMTDVTDTVRYHEERGAREAAEAARAEAERMARLQHAFLANMSHELRTPLTAIIGCADILADEAPEDLREFSSSILSAGERLMTTLSSILDFAQIEAGRMVAHPSALDLGPFVRTAIAPLASQAQAKGLTLALRLAPDLPLAVTDPDLLGRALTNLLGNAIKFTEQGTVSVHIRHDADRLQIEVQDTGIGISEAAQAHLFTPFHQASDGHGRTHEGSGLGLAVTRRVVDLLGGSIAVESAEGQGSCFRIELPRSAQARA